jgi:hypothetical protein
MDLSKRFYKHVGAFVIKKEYAYDIIRALLENAYTVCSRIRRDGDVGVIFYVNSDDMLTGFDNGIKYLGRATISNNGVGWRRFAEILKENGYCVEIDTYSFDPDRNEFREADIGFYKTTTEISSYAELLEMWKKVAGMKIC